MFAKQKTGNTIQIQKHDSKNKQTPELVQWKYENDKMIKPSNENRK